MYSRNMDDDGRIICPVCNEPINDIEHNKTVNHRFCFRKLEYNKNRKRLIRDRHGIVLKVEPEENKNFFFFTDLQGKYVTQVTPEQLRLHNRKIAYKCTIQNTRTMGIYVTNTNILHSSNYFSIIHPNQFGEHPNTFVKLLPGGEYTFHVIFETKILTGASYKIPLSCDFQTIDNKSNFTIVRTFLTVVNDQTAQKVEKQKSPFTSQPWTEVQSTIPTSKYQSKDSYAIPSEYFKLLSHGLKPFENMDSNQTNILNALRHRVTNLSKENYNKFWHLLLWMEEIAQTLMLTRYNMQCVKMELKRDILILEVPGLAEKRPSVIVGDFIKIRLTGDHTAYKGFVSKVNDKTIEISHVNYELFDYIRTDPDTEMDVSFMLGRLAFERMHIAVDTLAVTGIVKILFPVRTNFPNHTTHQLTNLFNKSIGHNAEQRNAVHKIVNSVQDLPYIVFGPPGTGKTVTIVEAILQIKELTSKKILVCAPGNAACDMLAVKLMEQCRPNELLRVQSATRDKSTIPEELKGYSNIKDDEIIKVSSGTVLSYRIIVTTLVLVGRFAGSYHPDYIFIDEAAQACEPETDIAIALMKPGKKVILAGDPKQLGPATTAVAQKYGLGISLLERLMNCDVYKLNPATRTYDTNFITMLKLNFRSHPDILSLPNKLFYHNLLKAKSVEAQRDPIGNIAIYPMIRKKGTETPGRAIEFFSISSKECREGSSPSFFNLMEAKMVVKYVEAIFKLNLAQAYQVKEDQVGIVTPYKRQVFKIKDELRRHGFREIEVGTTEAFQGREKRIIIISTVRAQHSLLLHDRKYNLGFVSNDQRFNVALTRAISKLIVIGCPLVLRRDAKWADYMDLCNEFKTYFGNKFAADNEAFRKDVLQRTHRFKHIDDQYKN